MQPCARKSKPSPTFALARGGRPTKYRCRQRAGSARHAGELHVHCDSARAASFPWRTPVVLIAVRLRHRADRLRAALVARPVPARRCRSTHGWGRDVVLARARHPESAVGRGAAVRRRASPTVSARCACCRVGAILYAIGLVCMASATTPAMLDLSAGVMIGFGLVGLLVPDGDRRARQARAGKLALVRVRRRHRGRIVRPVPVSRRSAHALIEAFGWQTALLVFAGTLLLVLPLSLVLATPPAPPSVAGAPSRSRRGRRWSRRSVTAATCCWCSASSPAASSSPSSPCICRPIWSTAGSRRRDRRLDLAIIGLFNIVGSLGSGWLGDRMPKRYLLSIIYFGRALSIVGLHAAAGQHRPRRLIFGAVTGLLWLSTVPPTSGLVALMFGTRWLAMLFGFAFFSHQVGGFLGVWLGGLAFETHRLLRPGLVAVGVLRRGLGGHQPADRREAGGAAHRRRRIIASMTAGSTASTPPTSSSWRTPLVIVICGCLIALISFGPRSTFGFFLTPMSQRQRLGPRRLRARDGDPEAALGRGAAVRRRARRPLRHGAGARAAARCSMRPASVWMALCDDAARAAPVGRRADRLRPRRLLVHARARRLRQAAAAGMALASRSASARRPARSGSSCSRRSPSALIDKFGWQTDAADLRRRAAADAAAGARARGAAPCARRGAVHAAPGRSRDAGAGAKRSAIAAMCCWCSASSPAASSSSSSPCICRPIWSIAGCRLEVGGWTLAVIGLFNIVGSIALGLPRAT